MVIRIYEGTEYERTIGQSFTEQRMFKKVVSKSKHLFRKLDAWGIDGAYFRDVLLPGNYSIYVYDKEEKRTYVTDAKAMARDGTYLHFQIKTPDGEDHRTQIFLPRRYWIVNPQNL